MKWRTDPSGMFIESDNGYRVCKDNVRGVWKYCAWTPGQTLKRRLIAVKESADEAKQACEDYAIDH